MSNEKNLALRSNSGGEGRLTEVTLDRAAREISNVSRGGGKYRVAGGKEDYFARVYLRLAREQGIFTKIVDVGKDGDKAWVKVRAWKGPEDHPTEISEAAIVERHEDSLRQGIFDAIENGATFTVGWDDRTNKPIRNKVRPDWEVGPNGFPRLTNADQAMQFMRVHLHDISMVERKIITMAKRNAVRDLIQEGSEDDSQEEDRPVRDRESRKNESSQPVPGQQPGNKGNTASVQGHSEIDPEVEKLRAEIRSIVMGIADGDLDLAKEFFRDLTGNIEGMETLSSPNKITTLPQAQAILAALPRRQPLEEVGSEDLSQ